jgi:LemA protein
MDPVTITVIAVLVGLLIFVVAGIAGSYNGLVGARNQVKNAWAQIDVQLKRRYDLIPNLIETVKGYMNHERETLEAVTKARQQAISCSGGAVEQAKMENMLTQSLRSLFAVSEAYPDLKANQNFSSLQEELVSTENKIGFARQFYNDCVMKFNNAVEMFPSNIVAGMFNFQKAEPFELNDETERKAPKVSF